MLEGPQDPLFDELEFMHDTDSLHHEQVGDPLDEHPSSDITRIYAQNINGLKWDKDGGRWPYICDVMSSLQVDVACFSELNTNTNKYQVRNQMEKICKNHFQQSRLVMASSTHKTKRDYKPGGTSIMACNDITSQIKSHSRDRMGRWTSLCFSTAARPIRIISAYQVCKNSNRGTTTAAAQQQACIISERSAIDESIRPDPRQAFIHDLQAFITQIQAAQEEIIVVGDFNEEITSPNSKMGALAARCGLADVFAVRLGSSTRPSTYQRGTKRLDYILASPSLLPHIRAAGYDPFAYRIPSDHRGMYIDFDTEALFRQKLPPLAPASRRDFSSKTPGVVNQYVTAKMQYLQDHNFFSRLRNLMSQEVPNHDLAEALDRDFQRASLHAARKCTKKKRTPWSPQLASIWASLHYYRLVKSSLTVQADLLPAIHKLQNTWPHLPKNIPTDEQTIQTGYREALQQLQSARRRAKELRDEYLAQKAELYQALDQKGKAKIVQRLRRAEAQHQIYRKINNIRAQEEGVSGLNNIRIPKSVSITDTDAMKALPDSDEFWETINVPSQIEQLLLQRNRHHFGQANVTPFATAPLVMDVGYKADRCAVEVILKGNAYYPTLTNAAQHVIRHLQQRSTSIIEEKITPQQILGKLKRWKEETTTSPSGLHLGHYHCLWRKPQAVDAADNSAATIKAHQETLLQAMADLLNYAIQYGYSFHRWRKIVNVMLQKDIGNPRIHRLRIIHIYEADYNLLLAVKWRQALHHAESNQLLNDGLYGSRKGRSAHDPVLLEILQNETYRMSMKSGINFDLDATSCYDRILMNVASICSRRMGMHKSVVLVNASTLEQAQYHLKTNLGVSDGHYSHCLTYPIHGTGQGSGNSPTVWCFVCSALFDAFQSKAHGATFSSYDRSINTHIYMTGFVDDCTQRVNDFNRTTQPNTTSLLRLMTHDAQLWNDVLWVSGGALEQSKCSFHLIQTEWTNDGHPFLKGGQFSQPIRLHDGTKTNLIKQKSNYDSHKTLGCYVNPAHVHHRGHTAITTNNSKFAQLLEMNQFTRSEAMIFYTSFYLPAITYSLPMTPLSIQQCVDLNTRIFRNLLPKCGYNRNMSVAIRYAPPHLGGAGFRHLYFEQGSLQVQHVYKYLNSPTTTIGKLLRTAISWTQAFLGTSRLFLTDIHQKLPPVGPSWLMELRTFLTRINATIHVDDFPLSRPLRVHDRLIMDIVLQQQRWTPRQLIQINSCRRYLQAQSLADISNLSGTRLLPHTITGQALPPAHTIKTSLFNQARPKEQAWRTWRKWLALISNKQGLLHQSLGPWTATHDQLRHWPRYVYDPIHNRLFSHHSGAMYQRHESLDKEHFHPIPLATLIKAKGYPTTVISIRDRLRPQLAIQSSEPPALIHNLTTLTYHTPWEAELLDGVRHLIPFTAIKSHVHAGDIILCSDGSAGQTKASFGFIIATVQGVRLATGRGPAPGAQSNSFRSEAYGVLASLLWLKQISRHIPPLHRPLPKLIHYLDNKSVIYRVNSSRQHTYLSPNTHLKPDHDVIQEIVHLLSTVPWYVELQWVQGHQDADMELHQLPLPAQLNCEADQEAALYASSAHSALVVTPLPHSPCRVIIQGESITGHYRRRIRYAATTPTLHHYMISKFGWTQGTIQWIDWASHSEIVLKFRDRRVTIVKHLFDISPTGTIAHRNDPFLPHQCPACNSDYENNDHVLRCGAQSRQQWRQETLHQLQRYDQPCHDPILMDLLHDGLRRYFSGIEPPIMAHYPERYHPLITQQDAIGWDQIFKARWSRQWGQLQIDYETRNHVIKPSKTRWTTMIGRKLLERWLQVWDIRNEERHGKDAEQQQAVQFQHITKQLEDLYSYKTKVCPADAHLFYDNVVEHLHNHPSLNQVEDWITMNSDAIRASASLATKLGLQRNRIITDYPTFNPAILAGGQASLTAGLPTG